MTFESSYRNPDGTFPPDRTHKAHPHNSWLSSYNDTMSFTATDFTSILFSFMLGGFVGLVVGRFIEKIFDRMDAVPMKLRLLLAFLILSATSIAFELFLEQSGIALMMAFALGFGLVTTLHELIFPDSGKE